MPLPGITHTHTHTHTHSHTRTHSGTPARARAHTHTHSPESAAGKFADGSIRAAHVMLQHANTLQVLVQCFKSHRPSTLIYIYIIYIHSLP